MTANTRAELHRLIDDLPDDADELRRVQDLIAGELKRWDASRRGAGGAIFDEESRKILAHEDNPEIQALLGAGVQDESTELRPATDRLT